MEKEKIKKFSPSLFAIILICFFLPFMRISCAGMEYMTFKGIDLVTGTTIEYPTGFGGTQVQEVGGEPMAAIIFLCTIGGLALSFLKGKRETIVVAISSAVGLLLLLSLKDKLTNDILRQGGRMLSVEYLTGYQLMLLCFLSAIGLNVYLVKKSKKQIGTEKEKIHTSIKENP